jgi:hypothetical protein
MKLKNLWGVNFFLYFEFHWKIIIHKSCCLTTVRQSQKISCEIEASILKFEFWNLKLRKPQISSRNEIKDVLICEKHFFQLAISTRVARCFFHSKNPNFGLILGGLAMEDVSIVYGHLVHFTVFCYILWTFGIDSSWKFGIFFPVLVFCTK